MRKNIVAGNWKMNTSFSDAIELAENLKTLENTFDSNTEVIICPPFLYTKTLIDLLDNTSIKVGVQNSANNEEGAYTGEVSAKMIKSINTDYVIIGHSERREYYNENDEILNTKLNLVLDNNLKPIFCVGEQLEDRKSNKHFDIIKSQIINGTFSLDKENFSKIVIAYEPVWAIGTGETASPEQAQEIHLFIRNLIAEKYGNSIADNISILYGGSVKPSNAKEIFGKPDVDGGLIGGAALNANDFKEIINSFS